MKNVPCGELSEEVCRQRDEKKECGFESQTDLGLNSSPIPMCLRASLMTSLGLICTTEIIMTPKIIVKI